MNVGSNNQGSAGVIAVGRATSGHSDEGLRKVVKEALKSSASIKDVYNLMQMQKSDPWFLIWCFSSQCFYCMMQLTGHAKGTDMAQLMNEQRKMHKMLPNCIQMQILLLNLTADIDY